MPTPSENELLIRKLRLKLLLYKYMGDQAVKFTGSTKSEDFTFFSDKERQAMKGKEVYGLYNPRKDSIEIAVPPMRGKDFESEVSTLYHEMVHRTMADLIYNNFKRYSQLSERFPDEEDLAWGIEKYIQNPKQTIGSKEGSVLAKSLYNDLLTGKMKKY